MIAFALVYIDDEYVFRRWVYYMDRITARFMTRLLSIKIYTITIRVSFDYIL